MDEWHCRRCLRANKEHEKFCTTCGKERPIESNQKEIKKTRLNRAERQQLKFKKNSMHEKEVLFTEVPWGFIVLILALISLITFVGFKDFSELFECFPMIFLVLLIILCFTFSLWLTTVIIETESLPEGVPHSTQRFNIYKLSCNYNQLTTGCVTIWKKDNDLKFYNHQTKKISAIKISEIISFSIKGDIVREDPSLTKALVGDALFGAGGALVYSQGKEVDKRKVVLLFNYQKEVNHIILDPKVYDLLLNIIPEKEYSLVGQVTSTALHSEKYDNHPEFELLKQLMDLKEKGVLTEDEFQLKKKQILNI